MNYKQSGGAKTSKGAPKFDAFKPSAKSNGDKDAQARKDAMLARMKAAATKRQPE